MMASLWASDSSQEDTQKEFTGPGWGCQKSIVPTCLLSLHSIRACMGKRRGCHPLVPGVRAKQEAALAHVPECSPWVA